MTTWRRWHGLSFKLSLFVGLAIIIAGAGMGWQASQSFRHAMERSERQALSNAARAVAGHFRDKINGGLRLNTLLLANLPQVRALADQAGRPSPVLRMQTAHAFAALLDVHPEYIQASLIGMADAGRELVRVERDPATASITALPIADPRQVEDSGHLRIGRGLSKGQIHITEISLNREHGQVRAPHLPVMHAVTPLFDGRGALFGLIVIKVDARRLLADLSASLSGEQLLFLFDDRGYCIAASGMQACDFGFEFPGRGAAPEFARYLPAAHAGMKDHGRQDYTVPDRLNSGVHVLAGITRIPLDEGQSGRHVTLAVTAPHEAATASLARTRQAPLGLFAVAVPVGLLAAWLYGRRLTRRLRGITESVQAFAAGQGDIEMPVRARDEIGVLARAFDDMRRRVRTRANQEAEQRARGMLEAIDTGVFGVDADGRFSFVNPVAQRLLGYEEDELLGQDVHAMILLRQASGEILAREDCPLIQHLRQGTGQRVPEACFWRKDGTCLAVSYSGRPFRDTGGAPGMLVSFEDRTGPLAARAALEQARRETEAAVRARSELLASMSHASRTPMHDMSGMSKRLTENTVPEGALDNVRQEHVRTIVQSANTLLTHIEDLAISDFEMPGMDGGELIRAPRTGPEPRLAANPAVMLATVGQRGEARIFANMNFTAHLAKPVHAQKLFDVLTTSLGVAEKLRPAAPLITRHRVRESVPLPKPPEAGKRVLLVDDAEADQQRGLRMLKRLGLASDRAESGQQALDLCEQTAYDLILMDCLMPGLNGLDATRAIRDLERRLDRPAAIIVALTANNLPGDHKACVDAGMDDFLGKPLKALELGHLLSRWLGAKRVPGLPDKHPSVTDVDLDAPVLNETTLAQLRANFADDFPLLLEVFLETTPGMLGQLFGAWVDEDAAGVRHTAHGLRAATATFGAERLQRQIEALEAQAGRGDLAHTGEALQSIRQLYEELVGRLRLEQEHKRAA